MNFLENIFAQLDAANDTTVLEELQDGRPIPVPARELLNLVGQARAFVAARGLKKGDRCALLAHNGIPWVALDLALMAEGVIVVPLYARQAAGELAAMMKDCSPALICCGDAVLRDGILEAWPAAPPQYLFDEIFSHAGTSVNGNPRLAESDAVTIIYTSGTSGEAKGVILTAGNVGHMLGCTSGRLDLLMESLALENKPTQDRVFHYLPFCFAGSRIMLLTCLLRRSRLTLNMDLGKLASEMRAAAPDYFLNVPALLERMRKAVDEQLWKTGGPARVIYSRAKAAWMRKREGRIQFFDKTWLALADSMIFPTIRKKMIGDNLKALICGSAP
jgi:long-chain acyl-CoA synthetase